MIKHIILDTDVGGDPDDLFTIILALTSPELKLDLIVTNDEYSGDRGRYAKSFLSMLKIKSPPLVSGISLNDSKEDQCFVTRELIKNPKARMKKDFLKEILSVIKRNDLTYYVCIGPESNLAKFIENYPELKNKVKILIMGGSLKRHKSHAGHNVHCDINAAKTVFYSNWVKRYVIGDITHKKDIYVNKKHPLFKEISESDSSLMEFITKSILNYYALIGRGNYMNDPLTLSSLINSKIVTFSKTPLIMDDKGRMIESPNGKNTLIATSANYNIFWKLFNERFPKIRS